MKSLKDMSILVTGGGSGIGLGTARYCIERGAKVTICGRREDKIKAAASELGDACHGVAADITVAADRQKLLGATIDHGGQLDALVNNAGNMYRGAITELDENALQEVFHTNVIAAMMLTGLCAPHLAQRKGAVVFVGSIHTRRAFPGASPYAATKAAVQGLTRKRFASTACYPARCSRKSTSVPASWMTKQRCKDWRECQTCTPWAASAPQKKLQRPWLT